MKLFKTFVNLLQLAACAYVSYHIYQLVAALIQIGGVDIIKDLIFSNLGLLALIDLFLISCASSSLIKESTDSIRTSSFISILCLVGLGILLNFDFTLYITMGAAALAALNLILLVTYNNK